VFRVGIETISETIGNALQEPLLHLSKHHAGLFALARNVSNEGREGPNWHRHLRSLVSTQHMFERFKHPRIRCEAQKLNKTQVQVELECSSRR
jgi:hypothetical protein